MALTVQRNAVDEPFARPLPLNDNRVVNGRFDPAADKHIKSLVRHFAAHAAMSVGTPLATEKSPAAALEGALAKLLNNVKENPDVKAAIDEVRKILQNILGGKDMPSEAGAQCEQMHACRSEQPHAADSNAGDAIGKMQFIAELIRQVFDALLNADKDEVTHGENNESDKRKAPPAEAGRSMLAGRSIEAPGCGVGDKGCADDVNRTGTRQTERQDEVSRRSAVVAPETIAELVTALVLAIAPLIAKTNSGDAAGTRAR